MSTAQVDTTLTSDTYNAKRLKTLIGAGSLMYAGTFVALDHLWYRDYPRSSFHFYNDNRAWMQVDKAGHATTAYTLGRYGYEAMKWSGVNRRKAIWYGGSFGFLFLTTVEVLDGFSAEWGASPGDFTANALGSMLFIGQQLVFDEQKARLKYSFSRSGLAHYRSEQLGTGLREEAIKDYNGQTYWLSLQVNALYPNNKLPDWLCVSFGYGADGMLGGMHNNEVYLPNAPLLTRVRQYYLSFDVDLERIPTKSRVLRAVLGTLNFVKIPFPALEYNKEQGFKWHSFFF
jgi:hypothetical protein